MQVLGDIRASPVLAFAIMSKALLFSISLIAVAVFIIINNTGTMTLHTFGSLSFKLKESVALLSFFITGIVAGILLKS